MHDRFLDHEANRWAQDRAIDTHEPGDGPVALIVDIIGLGLCAVVLVCLWWYRAELQPFYRWMDGL